MGEPIRLVVHGHFYQPPRENPWTEQVGREAGAAPYHDWNERIADECYRPNGYARIVDDHNRVVAVVDNYEHLSFNMGPTLLSWLQVWSPDAYARMREADRQNGGAIAQAFSHSILPLAGRDETRIQVRWGLADFRHRFGRDAEGMWLPECAVDDMVLEVLAEEGVAFTILAPGQAAACRRLGGGDWNDVDDGSIDTRHPYRWFHPDGSGRHVDLIFYEGGLSHALAFNLGGLSSRLFLDQVRATAGEDGGLVTVATDGETFGHHHRFGERLIAHALTVEAPASGIEVVNAAQIVRTTTPSHEARVRTSSWSCAHGVGRWKEDCGCETGGEPGWNQAWRAPLRAALDVTRDAVLDAWHRLAPTVLVDPGKALDAYVGIVLHESSNDAFAAHHLRSGATARARRTAFTLLEARRHAMSMYASCGWFFNDLAGIETIQVLRYAARVFDLLGELGVDPPEEAFFVLLRRARSNRPEEGSGVDVWERHVVPARVGPARVVAHMALLDLLGKRRLPERVGPWQVVVPDHVHDDRGGVALCSGRARVRHLRTEAVSEHVYAAVRLGGLEVIGCSRVVDPCSTERDDIIIEDLRRVFAAGAPVTTVLRLLSEGFGPLEFGLQDALPDAAGEMLESAASALADRFAGAYAQLVEDHRATLSALTAAGYPLPPELRAPAELALARRFEAEVAEATGIGGSDAGFDPSRYDAAADIAREARRAGLSLETPVALATIERLLDDATRAACQGVEGAVEVALAVLQLARDLRLHPDTSLAQERVYERLVTGPGTPALRLLGVAINLAVEHLVIPQFRPGA